MFLSQISVSAHSAALAYRIRLRGNERGTPLPFNLKMSGCRQHRFSPVGDRSGANQRAHCGPSFEVASPPSVLLHVERLDVRLRITSVELSERDFRLGLEKTRRTASRQLHRVVVEWRAVAHRWNRSGDRCFGRWTGDLSVGAPNPVRGAHARFDVTSRVGDPLPLCRSGRG